MATDRTKRRETISFGEAIHEGSCFCEICSRNKPFEAPSELVDLFIKGEIVLFVGSGVSTEARGLIHDSFYETVSHILGNDNPTKPFSEVMQDYCNTPSGKVGLINLIKDRFEYIFSHASLYNEATRFYQELATFYPVDTIVTTNWDTYFEDECAATPFVADKDVALWEGAGRKVLKIHGTIANFGSIVATTADYNDCNQRLKSGVLGAHLKSLLATRTVIFIGYSLRDDDFLQLFGAVRETLADFHRQTFFVAPEISDADRDRLINLNLHIIETDGQFFIAKLKDYAQKEQCICSDEMYDHVANALEATFDAQNWLQNEFSASKRPQVLFCSWYQDGLKHSLGRIIRMRKTGQYSDLHRLLSTADSYLTYAKKYKRDRNYSDPSYCHGYSNGMMFAAMAGKQAPELDPPLFFYFNYLGFSKSDYRRKVKDFPNLHKAAFKYAQKIITKYPSSEKIILSHKAQLNLSKYV